MGTVMGTVDLGDDMGMYTEVMFRAEVDREAYQVFEMLKDGVVPERDHPFFSKPRASAVFHGSSAYFPGAEHFTIQHDTICDLHNVSFRSSLKDYDNEIAAFFDWVTPHVVSGGGDRGFIGYALYEEASEPILYYTDPYAS